MAEGLMIFVLNFNFLWLLDVNKGAILNFRQYGSLSGNFKPNFKLLLF